MRVRVLGCSGAIARDCRTTSFLVGQDTLIDAGTGVGDLVREEMLQIQNVFLTHSHLDHIACLPLMIDTVGPRRDGRPLRVHALPETIDALRQHIFNDLIWPDFSRLPSPEAPLITFHPLRVGDTRPLAHGGTLEVLPAEHSVAAVGYAVRRADDASWWVFSGDTSCNPAFWDRVNQLDVGALVIETAFSTREQDLARLARHLSPATLADELAQIDPQRRYPIYITHTKPAQTETIMREIAQMYPSPAGSEHDIRWLSAGQTFDL